MAKRIRDEVLDEMILFVKDARSLSKKKKQDLSKKVLDKYHHIDAKQLLNLIKEWSDKNVFSHLYKGAFPSDLVRKIFQHMSATDYFRCAHGVSQKCREWIDEDLRIIELSVQKSKTIKNGSSSVFYHYYAFVFKNDFDEFIKSGIINVNNESLKRSNMHNISFNITSYQLLSKYDHNKRIKLYDSYSDKMIGYGYIHFNRNLCDVNILWKTKKGKISEGVGPSNSCLHAVKLITLHSF